MNRERWLFGLIIIFLALVSQLSSAHSRFNPAGNIPGRNTDSGIKTGPCGVPRTATSKILQAGSSVRVDWQETIHHPGRFEIYFSPADDANFTLLTTVQNDQNGTGDLPHNYNTMITLPNTPCTACTLQLIQVMLENPAAPTYYYNCADIQLTTQSMPSPSPIPAPAPQPGPAIDPASCH